VFFLRSKLDEGRFPDYPPDALAYRGGFESLGGAIAAIGDSFDLEECLADHPKVGTWIIDEASFYDERLVFVMREASEKSGINFLFPTLILNFRKDIFNSTARLLLENATHVLPLLPTASTRIAWRMPFTLTAFTPWLGRNAQPLTLIP
jgi:thymidine kinase